MACTTFISSSNQIGNPNSNLVYIFFPCWICVQIQRIEIHDDGQPGKSTSASSSKERIDPKAQHLPAIKKTQQDTEYRSDQETEDEEAYLESQMEKLEKQRQNESDDSYRKDGIEKAKVREVFDARVK